MMVSKGTRPVRRVPGTITTADDVTASTATAEIVLNSISTGNEQRDGHLRSPTFLDTDNNPT